jgi:hypothetical protein
MRRRWLAAGVLLGVFLGGCGPGFPTPYTASEMARDGRGAALVHYLKQPGATATPCDRGSRGPRFRADDPAELAVVTKAMVDGELLPSLWRRCAMLLLASAPSATQSAFVDSMAAGYERLLDRGALESEPDLKARLDAIHQTFLLRPRSAMLGPEATARVERIRGWLDEGRLGDHASRLARDLLLSLDLERGRFRGRALTMDDLDELASARDRELLQRIVARVRDEDLVREARRRIVRIHIASSPYPEVRERAAEVEATVLEEGRNPIDPHVTPPSGAWLDEARSRVAGVLVRQNFRRKTVTLLAFAATEGRGQASILPSIALRGSLFARVPGVDQPITVCAPPEALDVSPCLLPEDIEPTVPIVRIDDQGLLHFVERLTASDAQKLVYNTSDLPLPFSIGGREVLTVTWPIRFEAPDPLVFSGPLEGRGPDLTVTMARRYANRLLFEVRQGDDRWTGVVEERDLAQFSIVSRGGAGRPGTNGNPGADGSSGNPGMNASCPGTPGSNGSAGSPGQSGSAGGPGTRGGDGGNIEVEVSCVTGDCTAVLERVRTIVASQGGPGGPGGSGGRGGRGGSGGPGGSGTSCYDFQTKQSRYLSGGVAGPRGADGSSGSNGAAGAPGQPGRTKIRESSAR